MKPSLSSGQSLSNFLLELGDFKQMISMHKDIRRTIKSISNSKFSDTISNIGSLHLGYQFGWKLFVKDLIKLYESLANAEKTIRDFKSRIGKPQFRHFKKVLHKDSEISGEDVTSYSTMRYLGKRNVTFYATIKYTYSVPGIDQEYSKLRAYLDILGLKDNLSVFWEAIPFSFVVDWFVGVGKFLQQFDKDFLNSVVTIQDFCYTLDVNQETKFYWHPYPNEGGGGVNGECLIYEVNYAHYERKRTIPDQVLFVLPELSGNFGTRQAVLGAALCVA